MASANEGNTSEARDLLTVEQAASFLQMSASTVRSYVRQGRLRAFRVAGQRTVRIARADLLGLLEPARDDADSGAA